MGRLSRGQVLDSLPSADWNRFDEAARIVLGNAGQQAGGGSGKPSAHAVEVWVKNETGGNVPALGVVKLSDPVISPEDRPALKHGEPIFSGATPASDTPLSDLAIMMGPAANTKMARAAISGVAWAQVDMTDSQHTRAKPGASVEQLTSSDEEGFPIAWKPSGTGVKTCLVRLAITAESTPGAKARFVYPRSIGGIPAYEDIDDEGSRRAYFPMGEAYAVNRDATTGEMVEDLDSANAVSVINPCPRYLRGDTSRDRNVLAIPFEGGGYVMVPTATDPFTDAALVEWGGSQFVVYETDDEWMPNDPASGSQIWPDLSDGTADSYPNWAFPDQDTKRLYLTAPGDYMIFSQFAVQLTGEAINANNARVGAWKVTPFGSASQSHTAYVPYAGPISRVKFAMRLRQADGSLFAINSDFYRTTIERVASYEYDLFYGRVMGGAHVFRASVDANYSIEPWMLFGFDNVRPDPLGTIGASVWGVRTWVIPMSRYYAAGQFNWPGPQIVGNDYQWWGDGDRP